MNKKVVAVKQSFIGFLSSLGLTFQVQLTGNLKTIAVVLTKTGLDRLGINIQEVFKEYKGKNIFTEKQNIKNNVIVGLDLFQVLLLLNAIIQKRPELQNKICLYNLLASSLVVPSFSAGVGIVIKELEGLSWFWTGEAIVKFQSGDEYPEPGLVSLDVNDVLKSARIFKTAFAYRMFGVGDYDRWGGMQADYHDNKGIVVLGIKI